MRNSYELEYIFHNTGAGKFIEHKNWKTGKEIFEESNKLKKNLLLLLSHAEEKSGIVYGAVIESIKIDEEKNTLYSFSNLSKLKNPKKLSNLILKEGDKQLSDDYIRPYAICKTPIDTLDWLNEDGLPAIEKTVKTGNEKFIFKDKTLDIQLNDFWKWATSDLVNNSTRGILAEFIIAKALGIDSKVRNSWDAFDLLHETGLKIEIKSAAYVQSWYQKKFSDIIFSIRKTKAWDETTNIQSKNSIRQADLYIFCLLKHKIQETLNPLDLNQWEFYILPTDVINKELNESKQVSLSKLNKLKPIISNYDNLKDKVYSLF